MQLLLIAFKIFYTHHYIYDTFQPLCLIHRLLSKFNIVIKMEQISARDLNLEDTLYPNCVLIVAQENSATDCVSENLCT